MRMIQEIYNNRKKQLLNKISKLYLLPSAKASQIAMPSTQFEDLQNEVIEMNDPELAFALASAGQKRGDIDLYTLQNIVINGKTPSYAYLFARVIKGADLDALEDVVVKYSKKDSILPENFKILRQEIESGINNNVGD